MKKTILLFSVVLFGLTLSYSYQVDTMPTDTLDIRTESYNTVNDDEEYYLNLSENINKYLWFFMGTISFIVVIYAGFLLMSSNGSDEDLKKANKMLVWGIVGIFVSLLSYVIVKLLIGLF